MKIDVNKTDDEMIVEVKDRARSLTKDNEPNPNGYTTNWNAILDLQDPLVVEMLGVTFARQVNIAGAKVNWWNGQCSTPDPTLEEKNHFDGNDLPLDVSMAIDYFINGAGENDKTDEQLATDQSYLDVKRYVKKFKGVDVKIAEVRKNVQTKKKGWTELFAKFYDMNLQKIKSKDEFDLDT